MGNQHASVSNGARHDVMKGIEMKSACSSAVSNNTLVTTKTLFQHHHHHGSQPASNQKQSSSANSQHSPTTTSSTNTTSSSFYTPSSPPSLPMHAGLHQYDFPMRTMHPTAVLLQNGTLVPSTQQKSTRANEPMRRAKSPSLCRKASTGSLSSCSATSPAPQLAPVVRGKQRFSSPSQRASQHNSSSSSSSSTNRSSAPLQSTNTYRQYGMRAQRKRRYSLRTRQLVKRVEKEEQMLENHSGSSAAGSERLFLPAHHTSTNSSMSSISSSLNSTAAGSAAHLRSSTGSGVDQDSSMIEYDQTHNIRRRGKTRRHARKLKFPSLSCLVLWPLQVCTSFCGKSNSFVESTTTVRDNWSPSRGGGSAASALFPCLSCMTDVDEDSTVISSSSHNVSQSHGNKSNHMSTASDFGSPLSNPAYYSSGEHLDDECTHGSSLSESSRCLSKRMTKDTFKVIILGSHAVGKSALINVFENNPFSHHYSPTSGIQFSTIDCNQGELKLQFYDASADDDDEERIAIFYDDVDAVILMYSVVEEKSFHEVESVWHREFTQYCSQSTEGEDGVVTILFGNKVDIRDQEGDPEFGVVIRNDEIQEKRGRGDGSLEEDQEVSAAAAQESNALTYAPPCAVEDELSSLAARPLPAEDITDPAQVNVSLSNTEAESTVSTSHNVSYKDGAQLAKKLGLLFFEGSTLTKQNTAVLLNSLTSKFRVPTANQSHLLEEDESSIHSDH